MRALLACSIVLAGFVLLVSVVAFGYSAGAPIGHTGAPAVNGRTCTVCHLGVVNSGPGGVVISASSVYVPGSVMPVSVSIAKPQNPLRNGYQMAAYDDANQLVRGWTSPDLDSQVVAGHVGHTALGNQRARWRAYFQTPASGNVTFYAAGLDADGNGTNLNDHTYNAALRVTPGSLPLSMMALPRIGTTVPLVLDAPGDGGKSYVMAASFGNLGIPVGGRLVPLSVDMLLMLTVQNLLPTVFSGFQGVLGTEGTASAAVNIPSIPALAGLTVHLAYVVIDPGKPGGVSMISNGLPVTFF